MIKQLFALGIALTLVSCGTTSKTKAPAPSTTMAEANPTDVLLVLSATSGARSLATTCREFAPVGASGLVLTKLDEAVCLGHLLGVLQETRLPVAYLTDGQTVPDDIAAAGTAALARQLLGYSSHAAIA